MTQPTITAGPCAYVCFAENGNCIIWSTNEEHVARAAAEHGRPYIPLFGPTAIQVQLAPLLDALRFYSAGEHYYLDPAGEKFDDVSGEPANWLFAENSGTMLEDGTMASHALQAWEAANGPEEPVRLPMIQALDLDILADIHHAHGNALQALLAIAPEDQNYHRWAKRFESFRALYRRLHHAVDQATAEQHTDDAAVDAFAAAMKAKLAAARDKGRSGWDDPAALTMESLALDLRKHVGKGDPVDVANYAMMIHQRGGTTRLPPLSQDLLQAIKNAPAGASVIEWGGSAVFISRDAPDSAPTILLGTDNDQRDLQAEVVSIKHLAGSICLQMPAGTVVPQDLVAGMEVDVLYPPPAAMSEREI